MPNWTSCRITVKNVTPEQIARIVKACENGNLLGEFFPQPDWRQIPNEQGHLPGPCYKRTWKRNGRRYVERDMSRFPDGSYDQRWYDWNVENWGTKWEASDPDVTLESETSISIRFDTAWAPPGDEWFMRMSAELPGAEITCCFDEPGMDFWGVTIAKDGSANTRTEELSFVKDAWVKQNMPEDYEAYSDDEHEDYDAAYERVEESWWDAQADVLDEQFKAMIADLTENWIDTTGELKGDALVAKLTECGTNPSIRDAITNESEIVIAAVARECGYNDINRFRSAVISTNRFTQELVQTALADIRSKRSA